MHQYIVTSPFWNYYYRFDKMGTSYKKSVRWRLMQGTQIGSALDGGDLN